MDTAAISFLTSRRNVLSSVIIFPLGNTLLKNAVSKDEKSNIFHKSSSEITAEVETIESWSVDLPLERYSGGTNCLRVTLSYKRTQSFLGVQNYVPKKIFKVIVDTGSPYLVIAEDVEYSSFLELDDNDTRWNLPPFVSTLLEPNNALLYQLQNSQYNSTEEIYGSEKGNIDWKLSDVQLRDEIISDNNVVLGVLDSKLSQETGGPILGLVKRSNYKSEKVQLRPTFLEQFGQNGDISSFRIDSPNKMLTLASGKSLISSTTPSDAIIPLVDLRPLGDFVEHYACTVTSLKLDGNSFIPKSFISKKGIVRPIIAVFDTGLTGCLFSQPLWDMLIEKVDGSMLSSLKRIDIGVLTNASKDTSIYDTTQYFQTDSTMPFFNVSPINLDWFDDEVTCPLIITLGQTFLSRGSLTIDINDRQATFIS